MIQKLKNKLNADQHFLELFKGSSISFLLKIGGTAVGYLFVLFVTKEYGAKAMGIFVLSFTILQIASVISRLGMDTLMLRFISAYVQKNNSREKILYLYNKVLYLVIPIGIFISFFLYFSADFIAEFIFKEPELRDAILIVSFVLLPMSLFYINRESLRGLKKIVSFSFFNSVSISLFSLIFIFIMSYISLNYVLPVLSQAIAIVLSSLLAFLLFKYYMKSIENKVQESNEDFKPLKLKSMLQIGLPLMLAGSLFMIMNWTDTIVLGFYKDTKEVGIYNVALKISMLTSIVLMAINSIAAPKFSEMWSKGDLTGLEKVVHQSTKLIFFTSLPLIIFIILFSSWILDFFGSEFTIATTTLLLLTVGQFFNAVSGSVGTLLSMTGHQLIVQNILIFSISVNIILNIVLVNLYGMNGVAFATMFSTFLWNGLMNYFIWKKLGFATIKIGFKK